MGIPRHQAIFASEEKTITQLSAPAQNGYLKSFNTVAEAETHAAELLHCHVDDLVLVESPDGGVTYCYSSQGPRTPTATAHMPCSTDNTALVRNPHRKSVATTHASSSRRC